MKTIFKTIGCFAYWVANGIGRDAALLAVRISMIFIFFRSGMTKIEDWDTALFLFEVEYAVPHISHVWAAYLVTFSELVMPILIVAGFGTRLAALPLLAMTVVIQFVLGAANPAYDQLSHYLWMLLLLVLVTHGAGRISLDFIMCRIFCRGEDDEDDD